MAIIQGRPNHIVLVNFWATWGIPYREEFPDLVRLYRERQKSGLIIISVSIDDPENKDQGRAFLEKHRVVFPTYIATRNNFRGLLDTMDPAWMGTLPATLIFNRQGEKTYGRSGLLPYEEMVTQLDSAKRGPARRSG